MADLGSALAWLHSLFPSGPLRLGLYSDMWRTLMGFCVFFSKLSEFCDSLQDPLRIPKPNAVKLTHMDLPLCLGDKVHCVDVLMSLAKQVRSPYD